MPSGLRGFGPRLVFLVVVIVLATATLTLAARRKATYVTPKAPAVTPTAILSVPDVKGQAYVFAKGVLEDAGFAWRVGTPGAPGYAGYRVLSQFPAPGTRVLDTGAPTVVLRIAVDSHYSAQGHAPQNRSPYAGTRIRLADAVSFSPSAPAAKPKAKAKVMKAKPAATPKATPVVTPKPKPAVKPKPKPAVKPKPVAAPKAPARAPARTPAFTVAGAKQEPLDEMTMPARAQQLSAWVAAHPTASSANVQHWLYQHSWIVAGARFGWWHGAEALTTLIGVDQTVQRQWAMGSKSEAEARSALAFVAAHSR